MLTSIYLENFKKHLKLRVEFTSGVNVILGQNYSGKTTILEAIAYAFRGPLAVEGGNSVIAHDDGGKVKVVLNFEADGCDWILVRKQDTASLESDDGRTANGTTAVNGMLQDLMGFESKLFNVLKHSAQGDAQLLLKEGETKVNQMLEKLSGVDLVDQILSNLRTYKSVANGVLEGLETVTEEEIKEQSTLLHNAEHDSVEFDRHLSSAEADRLALQIDRDTAHDTVTHLRETRNEQVKLMQEQTRLQSSVDSRGEQLESYRTDLEEFGDLTDEGVADSEAEVVAAETLFAKYSQLAHRLTSSEQDFTRRQATVKSRELELDSLQAKKLTIETDLKSGISDEEYTELMDAYKTLARREDELTDIIVNGRCETCLRPYDNDGESVAALEQELKQVQADLTPAAEAFHAGTAEVGKVQALKLELAGVSGELTSADSAVQHWKDRESEAEQEVAEVQEELEELKRGPTILPEGEIQAMQAALISTHRRNTKRLHLIEVIEKAEILLDSKRQALQNLPEFEPIDDEVYEVAQNMLDEAEQDLQTVGNSIATLRGNLKLARLNVTNGLDRLKAMKRAVEETEKHTNRVDKSDRLAKFLRINRTTLLSNIWSTVLAQASYVVGMVTGGAVDRVMREDGAGLTYREGGREKPVAAASGCQKTIIGVAIRSAIAKIFEGNLKFMLLDEISADMDSEHVSATMAILEQLNDQIILITHSDAELRDSHNLIEL